MLVAVGAAIFANEILSLLSLLGVIIASLGTSIAFLHELSLLCDRDFNVTVPIFNNFDFSDKAGII